MFELLPESVVVLLPAFSLLLIGQAVERHYIGRITCFTNSLALIVHYVTVTDPGNLLRIHANIGLLLGIIGFIAYIEERSLPESYYGIAYLGYGSLVVGSIILYPQIYWVLSLIFSNATLVAVLVVSIAIIYNTLMMVFTGDEFVYMGAKPAAVDEFLGDWRVRISDDYGRLVWVSLEDLIDE